MTDTSKELVRSRKSDALRIALAPIADYLNDAVIVEVMVNADGKVWVDALGKGMYDTGKVMYAEEIERIIRLVASSINSEVNDRHPSLAAKLPEWGARVQASVPPIVSAPVFSLRKPARLVYTLDDYVASGILDAADADVLRNAVKDRKNILVGGGTGSGKTTFVNALLKEISGTGDRLYIVEDNPELQCEALNRLEVLVQPPLYTHQRAIMDALRFRPDRIIVGEVRDGAALEMLKAWNTGHPGGIATIHANSTVSMLDRLCQLCEEVMPQAPRYLIAESIDICIHIRRDSTHPAGRSISGIVEVLSHDGVNWCTRPVRPVNELKVSA